MNKKCYTTNYWYMLKYHGSSLNQLAVEGVTHYLYNMLNYESTIVS